MAEEGGHMAETEEPHLQRSLKNRHIQLIAIGGAIGTGLFMGSGRSVSYAGPSLLLIYLLIGVMLFIMMRAMGELLLHNLNYRSFQDFASDLLGPWAGFFTGWTYWILWVVTATAEIIVIAGYFDFWIKDMRWSMVATLVLVLALLTCNLLTVKLFGEIEFWFALIKIVAIVALIVLGLVLVITGFTSPDGTQASVTYLWDRGGVFPTGLSGFLQAFQIAVFAFIGIELIGTAAAETADPHTTLPRAINAIPVRIVVFYVLALAIIMTVTPWDQVNPDMSPFVNLFSLVGFAAAAGVMNFVVLTSASSSANSGIFSTSRMLYGLSMRDQAPKSLTKLSSRNIPARALFMSVGLTLIAFPILILGESVMAAFEVVSTVSVGLVLFIWSLILVCYIKYRRTRPEAHAASTFKVPGAAFTPWVVLAFFGFVVYVLLSYDDTRTALLLTLVWFVGLTVAWFVRKRLTTLEPEPRRQA
ncbi:MAG: amino acid permease [Propionibacteriaceae bacterium]|nr:amino acid permease [Propionibacteriaceae bacterium]